MTGMKSKIPNRPQCPSCRGSDVAPATVMLYPNKETNAGAYCWRCSVFFAVEDNIDFKAWVDWWSKKNRVKT